MARGREGSAREGRRRIGEEGGVSCREFLFHFAVVFSRRVIFYFFLFFFVRVTT